MRDEGEVATMIAHLLWLLTGRHPLQPARRWCGVCRDWHGGEWS